ncbi:hypothetical protein ACFL6N_00145 [Thermodesulfobacteriota bacterium]
MGFVVEQACPQCGVSVELEETEHLLRCPYCSIQNYIASQDYYRYVLPYKEEHVEGREIFYVPYFRFRGSVFYCHGREVKYRVIDVSQLATPLNALPLSLGMRPQAMKLRFASTEGPARYLKNYLKLSDALERVGRHPTISEKEQLFHRAYIGETISIIYLPLAVGDDKVFDAITGRVLANLPTGNDIFGPAEDRNPSWSVKFIPTLCPGCGWNLEAESDSMVLTCSNCESAWMVSARGFQQQKIHVVNGNEGSLYLPFWRITASCGELGVETLADFIRRTNQPMVPGKEAGSTEMNYWIPAFKVRPKIFLLLSSRLTISQTKLGPAKTGLPGKDFPVTLPASEAVQSLKTILTNTALNKRDIIPRLPQTRFDVKQVDLYYLPFRESSNDLIQEQTHASISRNALEFGRKL